MSSRTTFHRSMLGAAAFCLVAGTATYAQAASRSPDPKAEAGGRDGDNQSRRSGRHRFADGFFTGRFRRHGMYSGLTLGFANCREGRNDMSCKGPLNAGETKPGFAISKEIGFRIPWVFFGGSYTFGMLRPDWSGISPSLSIFNRGYQHSLLAVIRPYIPIWRVDLGVTLAPGWSRQVFVPERFADRYYTQGFAFGVGVLAAIHITRGWLVGFRWDTINNYHSKICGKQGGTKVCRDVKDDSIAAFNMGVSGLFLSHRW